MLIFWVAIKYELTGYYLGWFLFIIFWEGWGGGWGVMQELFHVLGFGLYLPIVFLHVYGMNLVIWTCLVTRIHCLYKGPWWLCVLFERVCMMNKFCVRFVFCFKYSPAFNNNWMVSQSRNLFFTDFQSALIAISSFLGFVWMTPLRPGVIRTSSLNGWLIRNYWLYWCDESSR